MMQAFAGITESNADQVARELRSLGLGALAPAAPEEFS